MAKATYVRMLTYGDVKKEIKKWYAEEQDVYMYGKLAGILTTWYDEGKVCEYSFSLRCEHHKRPKRSCSSKPRRGRWSDMWVQVDPDKDEADEKLAQFKRRIEFILCPASLRVSGQEVL